MTTLQKRKILKKIQEIELDIDNLKKTRLEIAVKGYASATLASSGGSKSYSHLDLDKITSIIEELTRELKSMHSLLHSESGISINTVATIYS